MIFESYYWKSDFKKDAEILRRWSIKKHSNRRDILFEKKIFISAYSIRKLIESKKIGSDFPRWNIPVEKHCRINEHDKITYMNWYNIDRFYDLNSFEKSSVNIAKLSDFIIHSFVFCLVFKEDDCVDSFYIVSDFDKEKFLLKIDLNKFITMLQDIGSSDITELDLKIQTERSGSKIKRTYNRFNSSHTRY